MNIELDPGDVTCFSSVLTATSFSAKQLLSPCSLKISFSSSTSVCGTGTAYTETKEFNVLPLQKIKIKLRLRGTKQTSFNPQDVGSIAVIRN